ncbi:Hypp1850 [Branchiostoma lanceolatum]|uniref:Hypp1850 protein n=1 Tax=Branchiostoma lanceolatum TaxID=7740 RepID=A0A8J9ZNI0_BRALA|nr:Hypp1850 [Branchiostoma lanceolatum]
MPPEIRHHKASLTGKMGSKYVGRNARPTVLSPLSDLDPEEFQELVKETLAVLIIFALVIYLCWRAL